MTPEQVTEFLDDRSDELPRLTLDLLELDTQNPPGVTTAAADYVGARLDEWGLDVERVTVDPSKPNVLARLPGASSRTLCFNGHLDTVPFDPTEWTRDPLGERDGDRVYGRGATDMNGAVAAMLAVARAFAETGTRPPVSLVFAFVSDEETGGDAGLDAVLDHGFAPDACVIGETTARSKRCSITVADRGSIWLTLASTGTAAHGSRPMLGENAIDRLYDGIETLRSTFGSRRLDIDPRMRAIIDETVAFYAPEAGVDAARNLFEYPSINLGVFEGGDAINTVPASARAEVDIRLTASVDTTEVLGAIRACVSDCEGVSITDVSWSVGTFESLDGPLVTATTTAAEAVTDDRVYRRSATGGGDAKTFRQAGVSTVEFGFGTETAHGVDEYTTVDLLEKNARAYAALPGAYAAAAGVQSGAGV